MGKSERGPDMRDCSQYVEEIQKAQNCLCTVLLELAGYVGGSHWRISVVSVSRRLTPEGPEWSVATGHSWPNRSCQSFEAAMFRAIVEHDAEIGRKAFQAILDLA